MAFKLVPRCFLLTSLAQNLSKLSVSSYVSSDSNELSPANELQLEFREYLKPSLPSHQKSNDADMVANLLIECHDPYHAMESSSLHLNGIRVSTELVQQTLIRLKNVPSIALDFFVWVKEQPGYNHDGVAYDMMIDIMGKARQFDVAWQLLLEMDQLGDKSTSKTFGILFRRLIAAGLTRQAIQAFDDMERFTKRETDREDFVDLLDTLCKYGYAKVATEIFNQRKFKLEPDTHMYTVMIYGWCKLNRPEVAEKFFREMVDRGLEPNVITYNVLLNGICRRTVLHPGTHFEGIIQKAENLLDEMQKRGIEQEVTSYSIVLHVYSPAHKPDLLLDKLSSMKEKGIFPTVATYTSVIKCLCSCGRLEDAEEILNEMVANGVSSYPTTFSCFFKEFQGRKHADNALKLYKKMGDLSCTPSLSTYNILVGTFSRLNKMDILHEIWNDMKESRAGPDSDSYTLLIHGLCEKRKWAQACEFFQEMIESGFRPQRSHWRSYTKV
ncbi:hypothetical protein C5167_021995 [Papaver somniferum]|uniref:Pentacotripeptide-repeat region of PRORP domain-containing protein n=1 Tax=Papaver somniferum TaxID=3469 RepID=A0A4Y7JHK3_PAPSO|nr:hypothetical protein C5167_021995 [Papaver somniferum]